MIDSVRFVKSTMDSKERSLINRLESPCRIDGPSGPSVSGNLGNLQVKLWPGTAIVSGSISKLFYEGKPGTMGRKDTQRAIEKLSDESGLAWAEAKVSRVDAAYDMPLKEPLSAYSQSLGSLQNAVRLEQESGILWKGQTSELALYDKRLEMGTAGRADCIYGRAERSQGLNFG